MSAATNWRDEIAAALPSPEPGLRPWSIKYRSGRLCIVDSIGNTIAELATGNVGWAIAAEIAEDIVTAINGTPR